MCYPATHRHSIFCVMPPHILDSIAQRGTAQQRSKAIQTLSIDNTFRALRATRALTMVRGIPNPPGTLVTPGQKQRTVFDAQNTHAIPGVEIRPEGGPPTDDLAADEAYNGLGHTYDFFWEIFDRDSINDEGMPMLATVHFGQRYVNAFWDGQRMVFGDGDEDLGFHRFTIALDIIAHELGHGITEDEGPLQYFLQAGALNESLSDVFGSLVKQYVLRQTADQADWLIGNGLFTPSVNGEALRSMKAPGTAYDDPLLGKDPQPAHMNNFVNTFADNGGVHINSGIPNHAFFLTATKLGGYAWERAGQIWYDTLRDSRLRPNIGFRRFARLTVDNAARLFGTGSAEHQAVHDGWAEVGIDVT